MSDRYDMIQFQIDNLSKMNKKMEAKLALAKETLEWYAKDAWAWKKSDSGSISVGEIHEDKGQRAREVLKQLEKN